MKKEELFETLGNLDPALNYQTDNFQFVELIKSL